MKNKIKKFSEFVKDRKETDEKPNQRPNEGGDVTASDSIIQTGFEQSAQMASFKIGDKE